MMQRKDGFQEFLVAELAELQRRVLDEYSRAQHASAPAAQAALCCEPPRRRRSSLSEGSSPPLSTLLAAEDLTTTLHHEALAATTKQARAGSKGHAALVDDAHPAVQDVTAVPRGELTPLEQRRTSQASSRNLRSRKTSHVSVSDCDSYKLEATNSVIHETAERSGVTFFDPAEDSAGALPRMCHEPSNATTVLRTVSRAPSIYIDRQDDDSRAFKLWPLWQEEASTGLVPWHPRYSKVSFGELSQFSLGLNDNRENNEILETNCLDRDCMRCCMMHPNSRFRLFWDLSGLTLIMYDLLMLPMHQAFTLPENLFWQVMGLLTLFYWTFDLPQNFFVGYHTRDGYTVMTFSRVAKRYIIRWFPLDIALVTLDWFMLLAGDEAAEEGEEGGETESNDLGSVKLARFGKTMRVLRLLRMLRLMRLVKLPKLFVRLEEHIQNEYASVMIGIVKLTVAILLVNHLVACCWFAIGNLEEQRTWVKEYGFDGQHYQGTWVTYQYSAALHWSLTQFTPASMDVFPQNVYERSYSLVVLIFALVTFSSFISSITNAMTRLRNMNSEYAKQLIMLNRYLNYHNISTPTSVRLRRHLSRRIMRRQLNVDESDVALLKLCSEPLLMELHLEVYSPVLSRHPFFEKYCENISAGRRLCHIGISELTLAKGDYIFSMGEACDRMLFLKIGEMRYVKDVTAEDAYGTYTTVCHRSEDSEVKPWVSEAVLWTPWVHMGHLQAFSSCALLSINAEKFHEVAKRAHTFGVRPARYGNAYVSFLNSIDSAELSDLHDDDFDLADALANSKLEDESSSKGLAATALKQAASLVPTSSLNPMLQGVLGPTRQRSLEEQCSSPEDSETNTSRRDDTVQL